MGLEHGDHPAITGAALTSIAVTSDQTPGSRQHGRDLGGVMSVVVVDGDTRSTPLVFETTSDPTECLDACDHVRQFAACAHGTEDRAETVARHVDSRSRQCHADFDR